MLSKRYRLDRKEFDQVFKFGKKKSSPNFLFIAFSETLGEDFALKTKYGVAASKKRFKHRVDRNKIRRRIYDQIRLLINDLGLDSLKGGIVVVSKPVFLTGELSNQELYNELKTLLVKPLNDSYNEE